MVREGGPGHRHSRHGAPGILHSISRLKDPLKSKQVPIGMEQLQFKDNVRSYLGFLPRAMSRRLSCVPCRKLQVSLSREEIRRRYLRYKMRCGTGKNEHHSHARRNCAMHPAEVQAFVGLATAVSCIPRINFGIEWAHTANLVLKKKVCLLPAAILPDDER